MLFIYRDLTLEHHGVSRDHSEERFGFRLSAHWLFPGQYSPRPKIQKVPALMTRHPDGLPCNNERCILSLFASFGKFSGPKAGC